MDGRRQGRKDGLDSSSQKSWEQKPIKSCIWWDRVQEAEADLIFHFQLSHFHYKDYLESLLWPLRNVLTR